ncbi:aminoglycoside phosphotransferase family protein [Actinomadura pelletieri]|uniref:aminoglycoside phosphotransferase family protein n=1 Tax=Actinomadura pelletieri TaxID=111805 RepID=UPI0014777E7A|nr:aminoglycoside phosphotransferase family protein [Actinomadura pelletieri]
MTISGYSATSRNAANTAIFKAYLTLDSRGRARREALALGRARDLGMMVPELMAFGAAGDTYWSLLSVMPGKSLAVRSEDGLLEFFDTASRALAPLHAKPAPNARSCWAGPGGSTTDLLLGQLTSRWAHHAWADDLRAALWTAERIPRVLLHGDVKPDHLIVSDDTVSVVDWEAAACGPITLDHADMIFHALRDLAFNDGVEPDPAGVAAALGPWRVGDAITGLLTWRLVLWADRRRREDFARLPASLLRRLLDSRTIDDAVALTWQVINTMKDGGTPR